LLPEKSPSGKEYFPEAWQQTPNLKQKTTSRLHYCPLPSLLSMVVRRVSTALF
jgi:hypothetical protein